MDLTMPPSMLVQGPRVCWFNTRGALEWRSAPRALWSKVRGAFAQAGIHPL